MVGVVDSVTPSVSIAIPIRTAGESIVKNDSISAPAFPDPVPPITTAGGSVYSEPERTISVLYTFPPETLTVAVELPPPGSCGLSIVTIADV